jgi:hypothetical protein
MRGRTRSGHNQGVNEPASPPSDGARPVATAGEGFAPTEPTRSPINTPTELARSPINTARSVAAAPSVSEGLA